MKLRMRRRVVCKLLARLVFEIGKGKGELYRLWFFADHMHAYYSFHSCRYVYMI
jgi:hypothetical protein